MKINYQAISLNKKDIAETDRLYTFYTKEIGLLHVPAKGIRKSQAKLVSQVEIFTFANISVAKNRGRGTLAGAVAENTFDNLKNNYEVLKEVYRARDIFLRIIYGSEPDENIFNLFLEYLNLTNEIAKFKNVEQKIIWLTNSFLFKLYRLQGYIFSFSRCRECGKKISEQELNFFSTHVSGVVCQNCGRKVKFKNLIDINTIKAFRLIIENDFKNLTKVSVDNKVNNQMSIIIKDILEWVLR
ncbi:MAG: DNA repair protein RecO [Candidatus Moranbacteria bacterium]|nr:DNA repair protein RecO [Candidatus Moranbacteria bacterium]